MTRGMLHAETKSKKPAGKYSWSPQLREAGLMARYWNLQLRAVKHSFNPGTSLLVLKQRMTSLHILIHDDSTHDGTILQTRWKDACKQLHNDAFDY